MKPEIKRSPAKTLLPRLLLPRLLVGAVLLAATVPALAAPAAKGPPAASPAAPQWHESLEPALAAAAASDRYLLVDLYAEWCGWCHKLDAEVFSSEAFARLARDYVLLRVDVEDGAEGTWLQERLGATTLPTLAVVDADLVRVGTVRGYHPTAVFLQRVRSAVTGYETLLERDTRRLAAGDPADLARLAEELRARQDGRRAAEAYRRLLQRPGLAAAQRARLELQQADALRLARDWNGAERALGAARATLAKVAAAERRALEDQLGLVVVRLAHDRGGCTAVASLESFLREHPQSRHRGLARGNLAQLRTTAPNCS